MAVGLAYKDSYSEKDILGCVYDYFAKFREESIPPALATGLDLYDSLVFQKGVCRHQAELGRLIFSALDIPVEKKMSNNPEGESFHDYLVVDMNEKKIVMDFRYTSQRVIQKQEREFRPKDIQKKEHVKRQDQSKDFSGLDVQPNKTDSEELLQDGQTLDGLPMDFLLILSCSTILSVLYLAYLYQQVFRRQDHLQGPSQSHPQRQVDYRVPWRTLTGLGLGTLITGYAVQSSWNSHSIEHKRGPTLRRHDSKVPTLKEVLRGSAQDWKQNGEEIALGLLEEVPSVGSESETRFVSADTELSSFGTPVYNGKELIGYRIQYEVAAEGYFSGIVLEPNDVPSEKQEETLLLTREGLVKYEDYNPVSNNLIEGRGEERQRALTLTKFLSERLGIAFQYESELKPGNLRGAKAKTFGEL